MERGAFAKRKSPETNAEEDKGNNNIEGTTIVTLEEQELEVMTILKQLKELQRKYEMEKNNRNNPAAAPPESTEQGRRKIMFRTLDGILKHMLKLMDVCNAQGFVYGIIPENGKPISGASENLRHWWKDKVKFDRNGPAAIAKYNNNSAAAAVAAGDNHGVVATTCNNNEVC